MLKINQIQGGILVEGIDNSKYPFTGKLILPANSVIMYLDDSSDMVTFKSVSNNDTLFSGLLGKIEMNGTMVTRGDISDTWDTTANAPSSGSGDPTKPTTASLKTAIVTELPATGESNTIYLIEQSDKTFKEYIWLEERGKFEEIGNFSLDLSDYYTKGDIDSKLAPYLTKAVAVKRFQSKGNVAKISASETNILNTKLTLTDNGASTDVYLKRIIAGGQVETLHTDANDTRAIVIDANTLHTYTKEASDRRYAKKEDIPAPVDTSSFLTKDSAKQTYQPKGDYALKSDIPAPVDTSSLLTKDSADAKFIQKGGIKTVNGQSLEGSGDITIQGGATPDVDLSEYIKKADADNAYKPKSYSVVVKKESNDMKADSSIEIGDSNGTRTIYSPYITAGSKTYKPYGFMYTNEKEVNLDNLYQVKGEYATKKEVGDINKALEKILDKNSNPSEPGGSDWESYPGRCDELTCGKSFIYNECVTEVPNNGIKRCSSLTRLNLPNCTKLGETAFTRCSNLSAVNLPKCSDINAHTFNDCSSLQNINIPEVVYLDSFALANCISLEAVNLPKCSIINYAVFSDCTKLSKLTLGYSAVCQLTSSSAFTRTPIENGTGSIYVPASLVNDYKKATNWSKYANQFAPIV